MVNSRGYAVCGAVLGLVGIFEIGQRNVALGGVAFLLAVSCALRANSAWKREHPNGSFPRQVAAQLRCVGLRASDLAAPGS